MRREILGGKILMRRHALGQCLQLPGFPFLAAVGEPSKRMRGMALFVTLLRRQHRQRIGHDIARIAVDQLQAAQQKIGVGALGLGRHHADRDGQQNLVQQGRQGKCLGVAAAALELRQIFAGGILEYPPGRSASLLAASSASATLA